MSEILSGALTMGYLVAGLFFLRFWSRTRDALFAYFGVAFWILAVQRCLLAIMSPRMEEDTIFYVVRLVAFLIILAGIWQKNRPGKAR